MIKAGKVRISPGKTSAYKMMTAGLAQVRSLDKTQYSKFHSAKAPRMPSASSVVQPRAGFDRSRTTVPGLQIDASDFGSVPTFATRSFEDLGRKLAGKQKKEEQTSPTAFSSTFLSPIKNLASSFRETIRNPFEQT
jgi:hypothetical protein